MVARVESHAGWDRRAPGTGVVFLEYACGGHCGEGNFILLRRDGDRWKVVKAAMTWIS